MNENTSRWLEGLLRLAAALALSLFAYAAIAAWMADPHRVTLLLLVATESINVILVLASRRAQQRDWQPLSVALALSATFYFVALSYAPGTALLPQAAATVLQCVGVGWQIYAKCSLGRSFGLLPADRGIVTGGAYRWVRHPIYLGYFIGHVGFLLANFSAHNLIVIVVLYVIQALRILREERLLARTHGYREYCREVRYRIVPHVF